MKAKKITNQKELEKLQRALAEIGVFELDFQVKKKGDEIPGDFLGRIQKAAIQIITTIPNL